jgi:hypothetical protein
MPVNMDPTKKRRRQETAAETPVEQPPAEPPSGQRLPFGEETVADREKDLADAELKNLWDATEVIDMDRI